MVRDSVQLSTAQIKEKNGVYMEVLSHLNEIEKIHTFRLLQEDYEKRLTNEPKYILIERHDLERHRR